MTFLLRVFLAPFWMLMGDFSWVGAIGASKSAKNSNNLATLAMIQQKQATDKANAVAAEQYKTQQAQIAPWLKGGTEAVNQLSAGMQPGGQFATTPQFKFDPASVNVLQDPGYQFRMQQGQDALTAGSAAMGNYGSGNLGVALQNYGQGLGSQEYGAAYNRQYTSALDQYNAEMQGQNTVFNRLSGIAGTGQTAVNQLGAAGQNYAAGYGNNLISSANNQANVMNQMGLNNQNMWSNVTNSLTNTGNSMGQQVMGGLQAYNYNQNYQNYLAQQNMNGGLRGSGYGSDSMNFSGNTAGSGMVDNYGDSIYN